jgi:1-deoxy-D-xylulose-5-phosphate reductoisomerase
MSDIIEQSMQKVSFIKKPKYSDYVATDAETRVLALEMIK